MDFFRIVERKKKNEIEIFPDFQNGKVEDMLGRGKNFYAIWDEEKGLWSIDENDVQRLVDEALWKRAEEIKAKLGDKAEGLYFNVRTLKSDATGMWKRYAQYMKTFPDSKVQLDTKLTFLNTKVTKKDYASKRLSYSLEEGSYEAWDKIVGTLYPPSEREKIEWAIGAIIAGDSKKIEKFFVFYGDPGKGKGTIIKIIEKLFESYCITFDVKSLGMSSDQFSMEVFKSNPLVAVDPDGNLSRIEDNTKINKIVSHEKLVVNEKGKSRYSMATNCFMFVGSNHTVKITDGRSGIIRRLIDINPSGKTFESREYDALMSQIDFELGAIAQHCLDVYRELGKNYYKNYIPHQMIMKTDVFYNFVEANMEEFEKNVDGISLKRAYAMYKEYCEEGLVEYKLPMYKFREELKNYYNDFYEITRVNGKQIRSWYSGFRKEKFEPPVLKKEQKSLPLVLDCDKSLLDDILADCPAQYGVDDGNGNEKPVDAWSMVTTKLRDIDTKKVHFVRVPKNHIVIDFDLKNEKGEKDILKNAEAACKFPRTYAEFSKGGRGIHLHYIYDGDVNALSSVYGDGIEIKVFRGKAALRRRLSKCNDIPIAHLAEGSLPLKEEKMLDVTVLNDEMHLRNIIKKCLRKQNHGYTRPEIDLIVKVLDDAYASGMVYDVSDMKHDILCFAMSSSHQADYCVKRIHDMKFASEKSVEEETNGGSGNGDSDIVFFDCEVFPNLFVVNWKVIGEGKPVVRMINPSPDEIEDLFKLKLVGFNCRKYDNHMLYARYLGYSTEQIFELSQRIISEKAQEAFFPEAYNISYTDIYDFSSKKQSLKKWEIELGIHHQELGLPWDKPVAEELWEKVAEYCDNDVLATEAVWNARQDDFVARQILADIAGGCVNDTTNQLSAKFILGKVKNPQSEFNYRDMGDLSDCSDIYDDRIRELGCDPEYTKFDSKGRPIFPGYKFEYGKSTYRGEEVGEGGYVYAEPGIYTDVPTQDISGMHPSSIIAEELFGPKYTKKFEEIVKARVFIKHKDFDSAKKLLDGKLEGYLTNESQAKGLSGALKIVVNSLYGLTSARFPNAFRDPRNKDNIVAKRGALFMVNLKHEVQRRGYTVFHQKTDSIKVDRADDKIVQFIRDYGALYGYSFETEAEYDRICLVNDAVYIAYEKNEGWSATGAQFQQPYVFKTLFSGEPIEFGDLCEVKQVTGGAIYLDMNEKLVVRDDVEEELDRRRYNKEHPDKAKRLRKEFGSYSDEELIDIATKGHDYQFVGKTGLFYPIKPGAGGGVMVCERNGKYNSVTGTKGYRWLEADVVKALHKESDLDTKYHDNLVSEAIDSINKFGSFDRFIDTSKPYVYDNLESDNPPFDLVPCGDGKYNTCMECPNCAEDICKRGYSLSSYVEKGGDGK